MQGEQVRQLFDDFEGEKSQQRDNKVPTTANKEGTLVTFQQLNHFSNYNELVNALVTQVNSPSKKTMDDSLEQSDQDVTKVTPKHSEKRMKVVRLKAEKREQIEASQDNQATQGRDQMIEKDNKQSNHSGTPHKADHVAEEMTFAQ